MKRTARIGLLLAPVLILPGNAPAGTGGSWETLPSLAVARQETGAARIGNTVYVVGGLLAGFPIRATNTVEAYDLGSGQWSMVAPMPVGLDHAAVAAIGTRLYVMGGYTGNFVPRDEVYVYDAVLDQWSTGPSLPAPRGGAWALAHQGRIYHFGGEGPAGTSSSLFVFDPALGAWLPGASMPTAREHLNAAASGDYLYVIGGRNGGSVTANERYHPATDTWQVMAPMPTARAAAATAAVGGEIFVMGGETPQLFAVNEVYDTATDTWSCREPMPIPRHGVAAVALDDRILVPGGGTVQGFGATDAVDSFVLDTTGVRPPPPPVLRLLPTAPNPFRTETVILYELAAPSPVSVEIVSLDGGRVATLQRERTLPAGRHPLRWDGRNDRGEEVAAGVYLVRVRVGSKVLAGKVVHRR